MARCALENLRDLRLCTRFGDVLGKLELVFAITLCLEASLLDLHILQFARVTARLALT